MTFCLLGKRLTVPSGGDFVSWRLNLPTEKRPGNPTPSTPLHPTHSSGQFQGAMKRRVEGPILGNENGPRNKKSVGEIREIFASHRRRHRPTQSYPTDNRVDRIRMLEMPGMSHFCIFFSSPTNSSSEASRMSYSSSVRKPSSEASAHSSSSPSSNSKPSSSTTSAVSNLMSW